MKKYFIVFIISIISFSNINCFAAIHNSKFKVHRIIDADTIQIIDSNREIRTVRLLGIDCPETSRNTKCRKESDCEEQIPKGLKAKARAKELYTNTVTYQFVKKDVYHRDLGYIYNSSGQDIGLTLLQENLCKDYSYKYPHPKQEEYRNAIKKHN